MESSRESRYDAYVGQANWLVRSGRADLIDLIADEYELRRPNPALPADAERSDAA